MRIRLIKETEGDYVFWKVQQHSLFLGWHLVRGVDAVTCNESKAKDLYHRLKNYNGCLTSQEVIDEATI